MTSTAPLARATTSPFVHGDAVDLADGEDAAVDIGVRPGAIVGEQTAGKGRVLVAGEAVIGGRWARRSDH